MDECHGGLWAGRQSNDGLVDKCTDGRMNGGDK
jgi:hypothetical protein